MTHRHALTASLLSSAMGLAIFATPAFSQPRAPGAPASGATGLNALDENTVRMELASRGLNDLLDRSFKVGNVPKEQQDKIMTGLAIVQLLRKDPRTMPLKERKDIVDKLKKNFDDALAGIKDPGKMVQLALKIQVIGIDNEVSLIEFWGEDPTTQAQLRPSAEAVLKLYQNAEALLAKKMDELAAHITGPNDPKLDEVDRVEKSKSNIQYSRMLLANYWVAISLDKSDERRKKLCDEALDLLKQYDNDQAGDQWATIRLQIGKLQLTKGDYETAVTTLKSVYENKDIKADEYQNSNARLFAAIALLLANKPDDADKLLAEAVTWQQASIQNKVLARAAADATAVIQARISWQRAEATADLAQKNKFNDQAAVVLTKLRKDNPSLAPLIDEEILKRLPSNPDLSKLDTLLLQALIGRGRAELGNDKPDTDRLTKAIAAGRELLKRQGQPGADDKTIETTMIVVPLFAQKLGDLKTAAEGFLDYVQYPKAEEQRRNASLDEAMKMILGPLHGGSDSTVADLYERAMPIAINPPYNHTELAYVWGRRMQKLKNNDEAIKYLRMVPAKDPAALQAKYYLALALNTKLDDAKLPADKRAATASEIVKIADEVSKAATASLASAKTDKERNLYKAMLGGTKVTSARVALDVQNDPKKALEILSDIEEVTKGMPGAENTVNEAIVVRVQANMATNDNDKAIALLIDLAKARPINEIIPMVAQLKDRLTKEMDKARAANDEKRLAELAPARAKLLQFMADWVRNNTDPKVKEKAFDMDLVVVDAKREAADFEKDKDKRKAILQDVAKILEDLRKDPKGKDDARIQCWLGLISFELADYQKCLDLVIPLLRDRKLGPPLLMDFDPPKENALYWEARYKTLRSFLELAKQKGGDEGQQMVKQVADELRNVYSQMRNPGGDKWSSEFETMRKEVDPTINPNSAPIDTTEPTTKPE